jgi:hypothetical protein
MCRACARAHNSWKHIAWGPGQTVRRTLACYLMTCHNNRGTSEAANKPLSGAYRPGCIMLPQNTDALSAHATLVLLVCCTTKPTASTINMISVKILFCQVWPHAMRSVDPSNELCA